MLGFLKWAIPLYWPVGIFKAAVNVPLWLVKKAWDLTKAGWRSLPKPKSTVGKAIVYPLYAFIAIPGSVPYAIYKFAELFGYGAEMDQLLGIFTGMLGGVLGLVVDVVVKALFFTLTSLLHL